MTLKLYVSLPASYLPPNKVFLCVYDAISSGFDNKLIQQRCQSAL